MKLEDLSVLQNKVFTSVKQVDHWENDAILFQNDTEKYYLTHPQDCCESVYIEDIIGDLEDLEGNPILSVSEVSKYEKTEYSDSNWTFYNISTIKGSVTIRFYGSSSGYYSTSVYLFSE